MYLLLPILVIFIAFVLAYFAYRLLFTSRWFLGWLKGMLGLSLLCVVIICAFVAKDIASYKHLVDEEIVATIHFEQIEKQHFIATFTTHSDVDRQYELYGDQWRLDSRVIKWANSMARLGVPTGYRLDRLSGRYLSLDDERTKERSLYPLNSSPAGVDTWLWLNNVDNLITFVDARYGSGIFLPMSDKAAYSITLSNTGLLARPINQAAKEAMTLWQ